MPNPYAFQRRTTHKVGGGVVGMQNRKTYPIWANYVVILDLQCGQLT